MSQSEEGHGEHEEHAGPLVIFFVFFGLLLGGLLREVNKKTKFPYTPMLILSGLVLGYLRNYLGVVGDSTSIIEKLNPHMILFIFIPVLIFESGFNCDWFVFRKAIVNILILAAPGVLWGAILLGTCFKVLLGYDDSELTWYQAFTLGCVLSATDPVAVVALLKDLGASVRFNTLIEGESLLNDGTAMVFFMLFLSLAKGTSSSATDVVLNFLRIGIGGPLLGVAVGFVTSLWLKRIVRDDVLTANLTFVSCYMCFYIAEFTWVKVSGILAIVVLGLYMSAVGKTKIYPQSEHSLHVIWSYIQYACETLIFLMTGIIIGVEMIDKSTITIADWVRMFIFWGLMIVMRFVMVASFYPILKLYGYGLSKKEFVVLVYGGLRGALGLCLALMIGVDDSLPQRFRELTVFYMSGMAVLTILVNGLTCSKLVNYVQMIVTPPIKERLFVSCLKKIEQRTREKLSELKSSRFLLTAEWKEVERLVGLNKPKPKMREMANKEVRASRSSIYSGINKNQADQEVRFRILRYLKKLVWEQYETGECEQEAAQVLSESLDILLDNTDQKLTLWEVVSKNFTNFNDLKCWMALREYPVIGNVAKRVILNRVFFVYDATTTLIIASEQAIEEFSQHFPFKREFLDRVFREVQESIELAQSYVNQLESSFQMLILSIHTRKAALNLVTEKKNELNTMLEEGYIDDGQYKTVRKQIDDQFLNLQSADFKWETLTFQEILLECPMFSELSREELRDLRKSSTELTFEEGKTIMLKDKQMQYALVVISGIVKESYGQNLKISRGVGNLLDALSIVSGNQSKCVMRAGSNCRLLAFQLNQFREAMGRNHNLQIRVYKTAFVYAVKIEQTNKLNSVPQRKLRALAEKSILTKLQLGQTLFLEYGAYMFRGNLANAYDLGQMKTKNELLVPAERHSDRSSKNSKQGEDLPQFGSGKERATVSVFESPNMVRDGVTIRAVTDTLLLVFKTRLEGKSGRVSRIIDEQV